MKIDRINTDITKAKVKLAEWQARLRDLERQKTEQENLEIIQAVRGITASPEEIRDILELIRSAKEPSKPTNTTFKEETQYEE